MDISPVEKGYVLAFKARLEKGGHRLFEERSYASGVPTGRYAIADNSGETPETTDDGILWIDRSKPMRLDPPRHDYLPVAIKVWKVREGQSYNVGTGPQGALTLLRLGIVSRLEVEEGAPEWLVIVVKALQAAG